MIKFEKSKLVKFCHRSGMFISGKMPNKETGAGTCNIINICSPVVF